MKMELRVNPTSITANEDGSMTVEGYVNKTEQRSNKLGRGQKFVEVIKRGAWNKAIESAKEIHFLAEHDSKKILASTRNGSLQLREDDEGLYMSATISATSWGKDYYQLIQDGILTNMSFGFRAVKDAWRNMGDHFERTVNELELFEVSVVRDPAYSSSTISARGIDLVEDEVPASEVNLRTIEIRSDEDIDAIAKKLYEYFQQNNKVAEGHDEEETDEETEPNEEQQEETVEDDEEVKSDEETEDKSTDKEDESEEETEEETETEPEQEETVEEDKDEEQEEQPKPADKIRDFINKYKQEEE